MGGDNSVNGICAANSWTSLFKQREVIATDPRVTWREEEYWCFLLLGRDEMLVFMKFLTNYLSIRISRADSDNKVGFTRGILLHD